MAKQRKQQPAADKPAKTKMAAAEAETTAPAAKGAGFKVRALQPGYYDHVRRREGDVFTVAPAAFSKRWMERVSPTTPDKTSTSQQQIDARHDELVGEALERKQGSTGDANVLGG